jgi:bile acid:Na+ symporter, BASS family
MREILAQSLGGVIVVFLVTAMFSLGLDLTARQIVEPLRNTRLVARSLATNVILVPLFAIALTFVIPLDGSLRVGILLYAFCAGSEAVPKFVHIARGNAGFALGLLAALLLFTVLFTPWALSAIVTDVTFDRGKLFLKLLLVIGLPLGVGLYLKARHGVAAARINSVVHRLSMVLLFLLFAQIVYVNFDQIVSLQALALLAGLLFFFVAFAAGYLIGGPEGENRRALAFMTCVRGGTISMMIAGQALSHDPKVLVMATVMTTLSVVLVVPTAFLFRRRPPAA